MKATNVALGLSVVAIGAAVASGLAIAGTEVPISYIGFSGVGASNSTTGTFIVPDNDTTQSAYGGKLRRYDVHISKMIEVMANQYCDRPDIKNVVWQYYAEGGRRFMGQFDISCTTARQIVQAYGVGRAEHTQIHYRGEPAEVNVPVLNLYGDKIPKFMNYVQSMRPQCVDGLCPGEVVEGCR